MIRIEHQKSQRILKPLGHPFESDAENWERNDHGGGIRVRISDQIRCDLRVVSSSRDSKSLHHDFQQENDDRTFSQQMALAFWIPCQKARNSIKIASLIISFRLSMKRESEISAGKCPTSCGALGQVHASYRVNIIEKMLLK
jgi:hypothetical protein